MEQRDVVIIQKIVRYCERISAYLSDYHYDYAKFQENFMFQDACCMCVVQIGELVSILSEEAKASYKEIPWRVIKDTRNFYVHAYGSIDLEAVWNTLVHDIPTLQDSCSEILKNKQ